MCTQDDQNVKDLQVKRRSFLMSKRMMKGKVKMTNKILKKAREPPDGFF